MDFIFRADASYRRGSGHVMRCLTLAEALKEKNIQSGFICRVEEGHLIRQITDAGFGVLSLPDFVRHWEEELPYCAAYLQSSDRPSLVVDHYDLDARWEKSLQPLVNQMIVIDDLANRPHVADILIDQNPVSPQKNYQNLVSHACEILQGPAYALLRPQFKQSRMASLARRRLDRPKKILISMGGADLGGITEKMLQALHHCSLPDSCEIMVVLGSQAQSVDRVKLLAAGLRCSVRVLQDVQAMAALMAEADLAIGAAGVTALERCCMGLPSLLITMADNQIPGGIALDEIGAASLLGSVGDIEKNLPDALHQLLQPERLRKMSQKAFDLVDGEGISRVIEKINHKNVRGNDVECTVI
jgi:UDP-2,4-diacetamido-2,4,6-trideoxy-beta-L-altropyranose hydrolase